MKKFSKMVTNHNDGMLGEQLMMKLYNKLKVCFQYSWWECGVVIGRPLKPID